MSIVTSIAKYLNVTLKEIVMGQNLFADRFPSGNAECSMITELHLAQGIPSLVNPAPGLNRSRVLISTRSYEKTKATEVQRQMVRVLSGLHEDVFDEHRLNKMICESGPFFNPSEDKVKNKRVYYFTSHYLVYFEDAC